VPPDDIKSLSEEEYLELKTEHNVLSALVELGHDVKPLGLYDDLTPLRRMIANFKPHIVFNLLEEFRGEPMLDQNVVSFLELVGVPYTGCNPRGMMIARDKALSKKILHYHRIPVPRFAVFPKRRKVRRPAGLDFPLIVKSQVEEASAGISEASVVYNDEKLGERVEFIHQKVGTAAIAEQYIDGRELYVAVLGDTRLQVLPVWELFFDQLRADAPKIATRSAKWNVAFQKRRKVVIGPAEDLPEEVTRRLDRITRRLYRALGLSGYVRIDYRLSKTGRPYFLEANPNPDVGYETEFSEAALAAGLEYSQLIQRILALGLTRAR
jgi:D-alanine-D-alanine ligase